MFISIGQIVFFGIKDNTIRTGLKNYRSGKSRSWENEKDPCDGRRVLINYNTIPKTTIKKYNMPENYEAYVKFIDEKEKAEKQAKKRAELELLASKTEYEILCENPLFNRLANALESGFVKHVARYKALLKDTPCKIEKISAKAESLAKKHAMYENFIENTGGALGTASGTVIRNYRILEQYRKYHPLPESFCDYVTFSRKLNGYKKQIEAGKTFYQIFVKNTLFYKNPNYGLDDFHTGVLLYYAVNPKHYSVRQLTELVNYHAQREGKRAVSESWVKSKLCAGNDNSFRTMVDAGRMGKKWTNDNIEIYMSRVPSANPHNTWYIDGTPLQMYYKDNAGNARRLNLFVVLDACTRKIIGFDISTGGEDRFMVINALKMAVRLTGYLPFEIVSDNFSANKTIELKEIQKEMASYGVHWRFAGIGNAQDKSYVERFNSTFQTMEQSLLEEYIGEGITSKRKNGRIDSEFIKEVIKKKGMYTATEIQDFIAGLICIYNNKATQNRKAPNELMANLAVDKAIEMDFITTAKLFWNTTKATVKRGQINLQIRKQKYEYYIHSKALKMQLQNKEVTVRFDENYPERIFIFDIKTDELIKELTLKTKGYASNAEVPDDKKNVNIIFASRKKGYRTYIQQQTDELIERGLKSVGKTVENFCAVSALDLNKHHLEAKESLEFLELYKELQNRDISKLQDDYTNVANTGKAIVTSSTTQRNLLTNTGKTNKKELEAYTPPTL